MGKLRCILLTTIFGLLIATISFGAEGAKPCATETTRKEAKPDDTALAGDGGGGAPAAAGTTEHGTDGSSGGGGKGVPAAPQD